jgi:peroxiredoxin
VATTSQPVEQEAKANTLPPSESPAEHRPNRRRWLGIGVAVAAAAPAIWYFGTRPIVGPAGAGITGTGGASKGIAPLVDHEAPNFTLKDPSGKTLELKQFRGQAVLLNFWATWCAPCREEMPELEQLYREYRSKGLVVLGVSIDESRAARDIPEFLKLGDPTVGSYTFPIALDEKQEVVKQYKLLGVPQSYFIDPSGVIRVVQPRVMNRQMMLDGVKAVLPGAL